MPSSFQQLIHTQFHRLRKNAQRQSRRVLEKFSRFGVKRRMSRPSGTPDWAQREEAILFFAPEAAITSHFATMCLLAGSLQELGHRVLMTRCFHLFDRCPVMGMYGLSHRPSEQAVNKACLKCARASLDALDEFDLPCVDLRVFATPEVLAKYEKGIEDLPSNLLDFEFDSIPFGRLCTFDLALSHKICEFENLCEEDRFAWLGYIKSAVLAYLLVDQICQESRIKSIIYSNEYSLMLGSRLAGKKHGIDVFGTVHSSHRNADRRRIIIYPNAWPTRVLDIKQAWGQRKDLPLAPNQVKEVMEDVLTRLGGHGSHVYSPAKTFENETLHTKLGLAADRKILVAFTSSVDELVAVRQMSEALGTPAPTSSQPFTNQIQWLTALSEHVAKSSDLQLVVRVHPREGANKRESTVSQHLGQLKKAFHHSPRHCHFVWPEEPISSYDLGELADLVLTSWSSIAVEFARMGAPVLAAFNYREILYPYGEFMQWTSSASSYFQRLREMLDEPVGLSNISYAFRWHYLQFLDTSLDFSDVVPAPDFDQLVDFKLSAEAKALEDVVIRGKDIIDINLARATASRHESSEREESEALRCQLRRFIHFLHTGETSYEGRQMDYLNLDASAQSVGRSFERVSNDSSLVVLNGNETQYITKHGESVRFSPMIARVAPLCANRVETQHIEQALNVSPAFSG